MSVIKTRIALRTSIGAGLVAASLLATTGPLVAAPRAIGQAVGDGASQPVRAESPLSAGAETAVLAKAGQTRDALGFPVGVGRTAKHIRDGIARAEYDEVTEADSTGRVISVTQFDAGGIRLAVRLDGSGRYGARITQRAAVQTAERSAGALGLAVGATAVVDADEINGGWAVRWARVVAGVQVRGDETRVGVWPDGRIASLARVEHTLAKAPASRIGSDRARQIATSLVGGSLAGKGSGYSVQDVGMAWVEPNGLTDAVSPGTEPAPYRLAWVATVKPTGAAADYVSLIAVYVDAGDGTVIGGDVVE